MNAGRIGVAVTLLMVGGAARAQDPCDACREPPPEAPPPIVVGGAAPVVAPPAPSLELAALRRRRRANLLFRYELGAVYTHALERDLGGARVDLEIGGELAHLTIGGRIGFEAGATQSRLPYERTSWGVGVDGKLGRVRLGIEPRVGFITIVRATDRWEPLLAPTVGMHGECIVALIGPGPPGTRAHGGLDLIVRAGYDWIEVTNGRLDAANTFALKLGVGGRY